MKYFASLCAIVLAGSLPGVAASAHPTSVHAQSHSQNQFHFEPAGRRAAQAAAYKMPTGRPQSDRLHKLAVPPGLASKTANRTSQSNPVSAKNTRRHTANPPTGKVGFLSALDIPAGTSSIPAATYNPAVSGDFNGDGVPDIASEVETDLGGGTYGYAISVVLSNGDGSFQAPVLNPIVDSCAQMVVADLNNDGKSDLIIAHKPNSCGNLNTQPTFEVWLSSGNGQFTVSPNTNNTVSTDYLAGGTVADVNGDGKLDIVVVDDNNPANVFTFTGVGDGTFNTPTSVTLLSEAGYGAVIADVNGDGLLDIVDVDYNTYQVTVYIATSPTAWNAPIPLLTPDLNYNACGLTIGDLNGDGLPEIVTPNCSGLGNDITVYSNNGNNTFGDSTGTGLYYNAAMSAGTTPQAVSLYTYAVSIADVNGDGFGDVVATNYYTGDVTILSGSTSGALTVPTMGYAVGGFPYVSAVIADFNGDTYPDIVVPDYLSNFVYLRGYGDGTFHSGIDYYPSFDSDYAETYDIATGDFNGDGHDDVVVANYCYGCSAPTGLTLYLSNPDGSLQAGINWGSSNYYFVAVGDFDGNGKLDIAATDYNNGVVQLFYGDGTGNFTLGTPIQTDLSSNYPLGLYVGDFNNDGFPDLAIENTGTYDIAVLLNDKTGNFPTLPIVTSIAGYAWQGAAVADIDNGGNLDIVFPYWNGTQVGVLLGNGDGTFQLETDLNVPDADAVALADLDGNGTLDIAVTSAQGGGQDIYIALGDGHGAFGTFSTLPSSLEDINLISSPDPQYVKAVDVDGDGKLDLVYTNTEYSTVGVLFGKGDGTFYDPVEYPIGGLYAWPLAVGDMNGDGTPDVVTSNEYYSGEATVLLNNSGSATLGTYTIQASGAQTVSAGGTATFTLTITPVRHYNGTITLSCPTGLPALATCSFSPSANVTLDGLTPQTVTLTITTKAPATSSMRLHSSVEPQSNPRPRSSSMMLASLNGIGVFGMFLAGNFNKKRIRSSMIGLLALGLLLFLVGCGGSSNTTTPPPTKGSSTSTVTSSAATVLVGQPVTFTGSVSATSGTPTGTVTFLDGTTSLGTGTLSSGSATFQTSSLAAGVHSITISYGGDSSFNASTSSAFSQTVDKPGTPSGIYAITVTGTGTAGTNGIGSNPSIQVSVTVQ